MRVLRTFPKFAKTATNAQAVPFRRVKIKKSLKRRSRKVTYVNFENILENRYAKGLHGIF